MKAFIYQTYPVLFDLKRNLEDISKRSAGKRSRRPTDRFSQLALTGYFVGQKYHEVALRMDSGEIRDLASATRERPRS